LAVGGAAAALIYALLPARSPKPAGTPSDTFKTPGVKNIERAYTNGGATPTHTKAYGGTIQGKGIDGPPREISGTNQPAGFNRPGFGSDQRPTQPTKGEELFNEIQYSSAKGE